MKRALLLLSCIVIACHSTRGADHLHTELSFLQPFIDMEDEARAIRRALAQRKLIVDDELKRPSFIALSAASLDGKRTAARVITQRGVVIAEDADADDLFALAQVSLAFVPGVGSEAETLIAIGRRARRQSAGCVSLFRVQPDARPFEVHINVERFGSQACVSTVRATGPQQLMATVVWPGLSPLVAPALEVELAFDTARLDRPDEQNRRLHVVSDGEWLGREAARLGQPLPADAQFSAHFARAIARAAVTLAEGGSVDSQLGMFRSTLGRVPPGSPEAALVAHALEHIENGWLDEAPAASDAGVGDAGGEPSIEPDSVVIEPTP